MPYTILPDDSPPTSGKFTILPDAAPTPTKEDIQGAMLRRQGMPAMFGGAMGPDVVMGARQVVDALAEMAAKIGGDRKTAADTNQAAKDQYQQNYQPQAFAGTDVARGVGQAAATLPATPAIAGTGILRSAAAGSGIGAVQNALTPAYGVSDADYWKAKAGQAGEGALTGAVLGGAGGAVGKMLNPKLGAAQQALSDADIHMTPGQAMGGFAKSVEDKMTSFPVLGELIKNGQFKGITDFNRALYAKAVAPFGNEGAQVAASADVGNKGIAKIGDYLSSKYEQALAQSVPAPVQDVLPGLNSLADMVPSAKQADFLSALKRTVLDKVTPGGTLTPSVAKAADSELGRMAAAYKGSSMADDREFSLALSEARSEIREAFARANPDTAPLIRAADQGWATLVQMERAGSMLGAKDGIFTPSQLLNAIKRGDTSIRDRQFARGNMNNQEFAQQADQVLPNKVADSGSAGRAGMGALALEGGRNLLQGSLPIPASVMGLGALASVPYLPGVRGVTLAAMTKRPDSVRQAGDLLQQLAPYLALLSGGRPSP